MDKKLITVTSPLLPSLDEFYDDLKNIWESKWIINIGAKALVAGRCIVGEQLFIGLNSTLFDNTIIGKNVLWEQVLL